MIDKEILEQLFIKEGLSNSEISEKLNEPPGTVSYYRQKYNIDYPDENKISGRSPDSRIESDHSITIESFLSRCDLSKEHHIYTVDCERWDNGEIDRYVGRTTKPEERIRAHLRQLGSFWSYREKDGIRVRCRPAAVNYSFISIVNIISVDATTNRAAYLEAQEFRDQIRSFDGIVLGGS